MLILAIDCATIAASAAIIDEQKLHGEQYTDYKLKHSEKLLPLIDSLLKELRMKMDDIDVFAISKGPGSFTGLRIGAATVKAFAHPNNKPIIGISTLEACAYGQGAFKGILCPILDAQQNSVYTALFAYEDNDIVRLEDDQAISCDELIELLKDYDKDVLFCGDAVMKFKDELRETLGRKAYFADPIRMMPRASSVGVLALKRYKDLKKNTYNDFVPNYIRKSQAEVNYEIKVRSDGSFEDQHG